MRISKQEYRLYQFDAFFFSAQVADDFESLLASRDDVFRVWRTGPAVSFLMRDPRVAESLARDHERAAIEKLKEARRTMAEGLKKQNEGPEGPSTQAQPPKKV